MTGGCQGSIAGDEIVAPIERRRPKGMVIVVLACIGTAAGIVWAWPRTAAPAASAAAAPAPIPVQIAAAATRDVPVYLEGLGIVTAFNTVTVSSRVDGMLDTISFAEGQRVKKGDVLAQIDPRPFQAALDQAAAAKVKDEAILANAKIDLRRYTLLAASKAVSAQQLATQGALVAQLGAQIDIDQAQVDSARTQLGYATITAPLGGRTGIRLVDAGNNIVGASKTGIVMITQLEPISVVFTLPEEELPKLTRDGHSRQLVVQAKTRDGKSDLDQGVVSVVDNQIDQASGTLRIKATFPNKADTLWPGAFITVRVLADTLRDVVTVPSAAINRGPDGLYAYVVGTNAKVAMRPLKVGRDTGMIAVVDNGLHPGEQVVTGGQYRLQPGSTVQAQPAPPQVVAASATP